MRFFSRPFIAAAAAAASLATQRADAGSVTLTFGAQEVGGTLGLSSGDDLPTGNLVRFGYFTIPVAEIVAGAANPALLDSHFIELAATRVGYFGGVTVLDGNGDLASNDEGTLYPAPGLFAHELAYDPEALGLLAVRHFLWAFNSDSISTSTQHGIFSDDNWIAPSIGSAVFDIQTIDPLSPNDVYLAVRGPEESGMGLGPLNKLMSIAPVPEPHVPLLATVGVVFVLRRRRPHKS